MKPQRIQLSRRKGFKLPPDTIVVARPSRWGNPFNDTQIATMFPPNVADNGWPLIPLRTPPCRQRALDLYVAWLLAKLEADPLFLQPLWGKNLACWCRQEEMCHADVLLRAASDLSDAYPNTATR